MPWGKRSVMSLRTEFVLFASQEGANIRALCRQFGIHPSTGYKWLERFTQQGPDALADRSRVPHHSPSQTPEAVCRLLLQAGTQHPAWGARKLKRLLENQGHAMPAASTVHAILQRHGLHCTRQQMDASVGRFEHEAPNQLWQMDFKGHFAVGNGRSHPLTILDDHSRFALCLQHCADEQRQTVQGQLIRVFRRYGLPERMTMDNGSPWGDTSGSWTAMELWLMRQGIKVGHSRPYHPQTQGKLERFHRSLKAELLQARHFSSAEQLQQAFERWREQYNLQRPHEALGMNVPASRYQPSVRQYQVTPAAPRYDDQMLVRQVDSSAALYVKGVKLRAGKAFIGEYVGLKQTAQDGCYEVWWYSTQVGLIDLQQRSINMGKKW